MKALHVGAMVWNEIRHRPLNFLIPLLAIVVGVAYAVSSMLLMQSHQRRAAERVAALDDEIRKITLGMGFNINILPFEQNLSDFHASDFAEKTMPFEFVQRLAGSPAIQSVRHLRPALIRKMDWPEQKRQVIVMGVTGVVPLSHASNPGKPLAEAVPQGTLNLGALLAREMDLKPGQEVVFHGRTLKVNTVYPARGSKDDITLWTDLALVQEITGLSGQINLIQALECNCETIDRLAQIQQEVSQVLGTKVQVIELATQAIARAQARVQVQESGEQTLALMQQRMSLLLGLLTVAGTTLVGMMALMNVRERKSEVGILRALGSSTMTILGLFLSKALLLGLLGALMGIVLGAAIAHWMDGPESVPAGGWLASLPGSTWSVILFLTPLFAVLASWVPASLAARQDPAQVLGMDS